VVLFPFHIPFFVPRALSDLVRRLMRATRIIPRKEYADRRARRLSTTGAHLSSAHPSQDVSGAWEKFSLPVNFVTAPVAADLFLLAILAIGKDEVRGGTIGANNISPLDIMAFFLTLAYIAISIDASGLIRYLAFRVLKWGGQVGHRLFLLLYSFFFVLGSFIGNDPIILSGTAFLAYMTRVSRNIAHPRAWIYSQFAIANIASAVLVSSNPTNLVLAGAFSIKFIVYTANMIVPVVVTAIVLFPFLLYIVFADESLIPASIQMHELPASVRERPPINPNIPHARPDAEDDDTNGEDDAQGNRLSLEEIMNPFLDRGGAAFGAIVMAATLITLLALNAASQQGHENPVFYVTLPGAFVMFCWDVAFGWIHRHRTRAIAREGRKRVARERVMRAIREEDEAAQESLSTPDSGTDEKKSSSHAALTSSALAAPTHTTENVDAPADSIPERQDTITQDMKVHSDEVLSSSHSVMKAEDASVDHELRELRIQRELDLQADLGPRTLVSLADDWYHWTQDTFPTVTAVFAHLPFALVPFALAMFVLVQALVTKGWVPVFAYGWDHWVDKTGTVGATGGMAFLSVVLCNFAGTNIGTTILLSRVIQAWQEIHRQAGASPISDRTFWATVYSMALGVNYGAFSTAFSASLAGLLWRDILARKHIHVRGLEFATINLPIITIAMVVGCTVLVGEVYIMRTNDPYE
jgi:Na+/H+ antiporter NhaD/arsenite permease-like protein